MLNMKKYVVFQCRQCGLPTYTRNSQKTHQCSRCGYVNPVNFKKIRVLYQTDDVFVACEAVKQAKVRKDLFKSYHTRTRTHTFRTE